MSGFGFVGNWHANTGPYEGSNGTSLYMTCDDKVSGFYCDIGDDLERSECYHEQYDITTRETVSTPEGYVDGESMFPLYYFVKRATGLYRCIPEAWDSSYYIIIFGILAGLLLLAALYFYLKRRSHVETKIEKVKVKVKRNVVVPAPIEPVISIKMMDQIEPITEVYDFHEISPTKSEPTFQPTVQPTSISEFAANLRQQRLDALREIEESMKKMLTFKKNSASCSAGGIKICQEIAEILLHHPDLEIVVACHTKCPVGQCIDQCPLQQLSQERCEYVVNHFRQAGCKNILSAQGWGCKHPILGSTKQIRIYPKEPNTDNT